MNKTLNVTLKNVNRRNQKKKFFIHCNKVKMTLPDQPSFGYENVYYSL